MKKPKGSEELKNALAGIAALPPTPTPPYRCGLDDAEIRAIALDCGFKLKPQPDGPDDLNPYVYRFANEILATMPAPEDVARFRSYTLKMINPDTQIARFEKAYETLAEQSWLVRQLQAQGIGYEKLAPHLQKDADKRMGIVRWVNVPIFEGDE